MLHSLTKLLEVLFPPRPSQVLVRTCAINDIIYRAICKESIWYTTSYSSPLVRALIIENKFHRNTRASDILGQLINSFVAQHNLQSAVFVSIPLSQKRQRMRGYNQVDNILHSLVLTKHQPLHRSKDTTPQTQLERAARLHNMKGAFSVNQSVITTISQHKTIVLVDDVFTTGATLKEARAALNPHLPDETKIICLALAH